MGSPATAVTSQPWIVSRRDDLLWFQGSVVAGLVLLVFFLLAPRFDSTTYAPDHLAVLALLLWGILFDGTHVWGTYARSYLAPDPAARAALPGRWSWALFLVGPAVALLDYALCAPGPSLLAQAGFLFRAFLVVAYLWAYWHLVRQHYGFLVLYRRRAGENDRRGARLDTALLWIGCLYPYLRFGLSDAYRHSGLTQVLPEPWLAPARLALDTVFGLALTVALVLMLSGRIEPFRLGPKHLLLAIVIGFHLAVFALLDNLLTITATLTIFHNLQYHRIVWQYERGHGRTPSGGLTPYLALGTGLGLFWYGPRIVGVALVHSDLARNLLLGLGWGVAFHHYLVDGRIWRVRRSKDVSTALDADRLAAPRMGARPPAT
ncbi:MAG TPA: hypothetical protein VG013_13840 [Gemmataceae bacterium]|jgi:hypothetical protein|nr:hypothetical protein [Gemmataceae bacterium]